MDKFDLMDNLVKAPMNKWFFFAGFITLFAGGGAIAILPVEPEYQVHFQVAGGIMIALGLILAIWRAITGIDK